MSARRSGFTLIELLVVVAIIALLISILLPSLNRARQSAKTAVCATRLHNLGLAMAVYDLHYGTFTPADPYPLMPHDILTPGNESAGRRREWHDLQGYDPAIGWLAFYAMNITPEIPSVPGREKLTAWAECPYGFRFQSDLAPETLWDGFFCPAQNMYNTTAKDSPEVYRDSRSQIDRTFNRAEETNSGLKHSAAYMHNEFLRCATPRIDERRGGVWPVRPRGPQAWWKGKNHNQWMGPVSATLSHEGERRYYQVQATTIDQVISPAETVYMADSLDYKTENSEAVHGFPERRVPQMISAGIYYEMHEKTIVPLGTRHHRRANVLYADGHVDRDSQKPAYRRGNLIVASTFADFIEEHDMGTQHKLLPTGKRLR